MSDIVNKLSVLIENPILTHLIDSNDTFLHSHDYYEFFYITNGKIQHFLNGEKQDLSDGDFLFIKTADVHRFIRNEGCICTHRDVVISQSLFKQTCDFLDKNMYFDFVRRNRFKPIKLNFYEIQFFENLLNLLNEAMLNGYSDYNMLTNMASSAVIGTFYNHMVSKDKLPTEQPVWFKELIERFYELQNIRGGLKKILENTHYNNIYVCKVFKEQTGTTMTKYLNNIRLNYAALYLKTTKFSIEQIVEYLGFSSTTFFYNNFKKRFGCSPHAYKKQNYFLTEIK